MGPSDVSPSLLTVPKTAHPADACLREINTLLQIRHPNVVSEHLTVVHKGAVAGKLFARLLLVKKKKLSCARARLR